MQANQFSITDTPLEIGRTLIEASAGTGKTYTLVGIIARLLIQEKLTLDQIVVCTFTEAATSEMRRRVREMLREGVHYCRNHLKGNLDYLSVLIDRSEESCPELLARFEAALREVDLAGISTLHGFCQRLLQDRALETGNRLESEVLTDHSELLDEVAADFWRAQAYGDDSLQARLFLHFFPSHLPLASLTDSLQRHPVIDIVRHYGSASHTELSALWPTLWQRVTTQWETEGETIKDLLLSEMSWGNQPFSKREKIELFLAPLFNDLSSGENFGTLLGALQQLAVSNITERRRKNAKNPAPAHPFFDLCEELSIFLPQWQEATMLLAFQTIQAQLRQRKKARGLIAFSDMITEVSAVVATLSPEALLRLRGSWKTVMIDEFQDTDPAQTRIFNTLFDSECNYLFFIGDPKQSIYGFRGADLFTYLNFKKTVHRQYSLGTNFRSTAGYVAACNQFFAVNPNLFASQDILYKLIGSRNENAVAELFDEESEARPLTLWLAEDKPDEERISEWVASEIVRLLTKNVRIGERRLTTKDLAVLTSTHRQSAIVQATLAQRGVPSVIKSGNSVYKSKEAEALYRLLQAIAQPRRNSLIKAALSTPLFRLDGNTILLLTEDETQWASWQNQFHTWHETFRVDGIMPVLHQVFNRANTVVETMRQTGGERSVTNLLHLAELLHCADVAFTRDPASLETWLRKKIVEQQSNQDAAEQRLDIDEQAVQIITSHAAKGLEFPVVFAPYFLKLRTSRNCPPPYFHHQNGRLLCHILPSDDTARNAMLEELNNEQIRLLYVALTRASHRSYLAIPVGEDRDLSTTDKALNLKILADKALKNLFLSQPHIAILSPVLSEEYYTASISTGSLLIKRSFTGAISRDWRITSFTALSRMESFDLPDHDLTAPASAPKTPPSGLDLFPGGAALGTCLHKILEKVDFQDSSGWKKIIEQQLYLTFPNSSNGYQVVEGLLEKLVHTPLIDEITLADIFPEQRVVELEFQFPLQRLTPTRLRKACERFPIPVDWDHLSFDTVQGMVKGFIDLVWRHDDRYYFLDWKSNQLASYDQEGMTLGMRHSHYGLQYLLYCVALRRWLTKRVSGFSWEIHFGGVAYVFLRGLNDSSGATGIYRDRPSLDLLNAMEEILTS